MTNLSFRAFLSEQTASKVGTVKTRPIPNQIDALDRAIRRLAGTDPLASTSRVLGAYACGRPLPKD
jgi:hypothetical protein